MSPSAYPAGRIAFLAALIPACLFPVTYLTAAALGHVPWCVPVIHGCTDLTHTGLFYPEHFLFAIVVLVSALLIGTCWHLAYEWLRVSGRTPGRRERAFRNCGFIACGGLFVGNVTIGMDSPTTLWKIHGLGSGLFFVLTYAGLVMLTRSIRDAAAEQPDLLSPVSLGIKRGIVMLQTVILIVAIVFRIVDWSEGGRVLQWITTYSILLYLFTLGLDWRGRRLVPPSLGPP